MIPKKVKVLGKTYTIEEDDGLMQDGHASGICKPWKTEIRVATAAELDPQQVRDCVIHEIFHAIFSETALTVDFKEDEDEEKIVRRMATVWLAVMRENPQVTKFLMEK